MTAFRESECDFCEELETGSSDLFGSQIRRFVFENDEFAAFGALGSFVPGYLIMVPRVHVQSFAALDPDALGRAFELAASLRRRLAVHYGPSVLFEHGSHGSAAGGASIDHAHWHIVPVDRPVDLLEDSSPVDELRCPTDLTRYSHEPYVLAHEEGGEARVLTDPVVPSQFLRRRLAAAIGVPANWDWRTYPGWAELQETLDRLGVVPESETSGEESG